MLLHALVFLGYANAVGEAVVFGRLAGLRLLSRYKWFAMWMAFSAVRDFSILLATNAHFTSRSFWTLWKLTEPIALGFVVLVSFEVYDLITSTYNTLGSMGVKILKIALMLGIGVSFVLILIDWRDVTPWIFLVKRIVTLVLAISLMYISWVFLWAPGLIRLNVIRHCRILTVYLSSVAGGYFLLNLGLERVLSGLLYIAPCFGCLVAWTILLTCDGEKVPTEDETPNGDVMDDDEEQYPGKYLSGLGRDGGDAIL
jgi:hypothetical protein